MDDDIGDALRARAAVESGLLFCCICGAPTFDRAELESGAVFPHCEDHEREAIAALARSGGASDEIAEAFADHVIANPEEFLGRPGPETN